MAAGAKGRRAVSTVGGGVAVVVVYVAAAKAGINLEVAKGVITPVWAPTGIALVAVLLLGRRVWPVIAFAAFLTNATEGEPPISAAGIAVGNTLEAVVGAWLFQGVLRGDAGLRRAWDVLALTLGAAILSTTVAATIGTATLAATGSLANSYASGWLLWWLGDAMGALVVGPLLLVWARRDRLPSGTRLAEGFALLAVTTTAAAIVFVGGRWQYPYVLFPLFLWAAFRFGQRGATTVVFLVTSIAIAGVVDGAVAIAGVDARQTVELLQVLLGIVGVATMVLAAALEQRMAADAYLRDSLALYEAVLEATADGILVLDSSRRPVTYNRQFAGMWGLPATGGRPKVPDAHAELDLVLEELLEAEQHTADGGEFAFNGRTFERSCLPYVVEHGRGQVWSFRDVTTRRRAEATRERFLAMASHELRTPLTVMLGFTGALLDQWDRLDDDRRRSFVARARDQSERLAALVEGLLATSAMESGSLTVTPSPTVVADVVRRTVDEMGGDDIAVEVPAGVVVMADPRHVRQILVNFIGNAVKYGRPPLAVTAKTDGEWCELRVIDCGDGLPSTVRERLFERFVRAPTAVAAGIPGSGLGLAITRDLARAQGGDVWYEDQTPGGACFALRLPLVPAPAPARPAAAATG